MSDFDFESSNDYEALISYAAEYNIVVDRRYSIDKIKSMIRAEKKVVEAQPTKADIDSQRKVTLLIHKTEGDTGSLDVPVSVNGKTWLIKRGHEVQVPMFVVEALKNAMRDVYIFNDKTNEIMHREVPSYPFSVMGV